MQERRVVNDTGVTGFFAKVYSTMGMGILVTALVSYLLSTVFQAQYIAFVGSHRIMFWLMMFLPLILSFMVQGKKAQANSGYATLMFLLMSASFGFTLGLTLMFYRGPVIGMALAVTAIIFFTMSALGRSGKRDLTKAGSIASMALFGIILLSLVNMFLRSPGMMYLISYGILVVFIVLVAYDTQQLKRLYMTASNTGEALVNLNTLAVQGALMLYLDFLNIFLAILQIFGAGGNND